ncbi:aspartate-semialdehyde dehydrogenase [candidate division TA06 bacterium B3_TA06]|uniref:Aspartate-semialdehyde dehydrogenase n=1 Tax=candidate division TA06 bacterium B3_TA06 TaxID=2012487 RepID=A0A532UZX6_UNCT6|nr:MAG: aspartate-semialdehyde dehydrogenase [candidate division TA06 bacterium B3_TA06]
MRVGIIGATGLVGRTTLRILQERGFPVSELILFASQRSAGEKIEFKDKEVEVMAIGENWDLLADIFFCSVADDVARGILKDYKGEAWVIDKSKVFRMDPKVPLVVPEVNWDAVERLDSKIVANPNCTTIPFVMAMAAIRKVARPERTVVTSLQSASGAGKAALEELRLQREYVTAGEKMPEDAREVFPEILAANLIPQIGSFSEAGEASEERKLRDESRKILGDETLSIHATCVRVPVEVGHSLSVTCIFAEPIDLNAVRESMASFPGLKILPEGELITPVEITGSDEVFLSRLRRDPVAENVVHFWLCTDNLRKGAALNAVQIAETLI